MTFKLDEDVLRQALMLELEDRVRAISPEHYLPHDFSKRFYRKMARLQKRAERSRASKTVARAGKVAAALLLALAIASGAMALSTEAMREKLFQFINEQYQKHSLAFYQSTRPSSVDTEDKLISPCEPTDIPEGFELVESSYMRQVRLYYLNADGQYIHYRQTRRRDGRLNLNTEDVELVKNAFFGNEAYYYHNSGNHTLMWEDEEYVYFVGSDNGKKTVFQVAESVKNIES